MFLKKYFVFFDIYGNLRFLVEVLYKVGFDMENENYILLFLGDYFDCGVENLEVLGYLMYFNKLNRIIMIRGNYDDFLLDFLKGILDGIFNI